MTDKQRKNSTKKKNKAAPLEAFKFKPGQSGNPKGRPPNKKVLSELLREVGVMDCPETEQTKKLKSFFNIPIDQPCSFDKLTALAIRYGAIPAAMKGNIGPVALILDRVEGKSTQPLDIPEDSALARLILVSRK